MEAVATKLEGNDREARLAKLVAVMAHTKSRLLAKHINKLADSVVNPKTLTLKILKPEALKFSKT